MSTNTKSGGMGFCSVLTLIFIVLRLCGVIDWSWWWVLAPLWIPAALLCICTVLIELLKNNDK